MEKLPDLERLISQAYCQINLKQFPYQRLKDFYSLISQLQLLKQSVAIFTHVSENFKSARLRDLVTSENQGGGFPDLD